MQTTHSVFSLPRPMWRIAKRALTNALLAEAIVFVLGILVSLGILTTGATMYMSQEGFTLSGSAEEDSLAQEVSGDLVGFFVGDLNANWLAFFVLSAIGVAVIFYTWSLVQAGYTRTYLAAGVGRNWILTAMLIASLVHAIIYGILTFLGSLLLMVAGDDFSGKVMINGVQTDSHFLWMLPVWVMFLAFSLSVSAYALAMVFVRLSWWIPFAAIVAISMVVQVGQAVFADNVIGKGFHLLGMILGQIIPFIFTNGIFVIFTAMHINDFAVFFLGMVACFATIGVCMYRLPLKR